MSKIIEILHAEEGYREQPYRCTEGYPTIAGGIRIGPKGASLANYTFTVPLVVDDCWMQYLVDDIRREMRKCPAISAALNLCNEAREDVLISMAYQMGVDGLATFKNTLKMIATGDYENAAAGMLNSLWARQTPRRAQRHAEAMRSGSHSPWGL